MLLSILAVLLIALTQQIIFPSMGVFFLGQWLIFSFVFLTSFFQKGNSPVILALMAGVLIDLISGSFFGTFTLSLFFVALIVKTAQQRIRSNSLIAFIVILFFCSGLFWVVSHFLNYVFAFI